MTKNSRLVQRRRGDTRRGRLKLLLQLLVSLVFLATAALLSAGIVKVVERPVAPWNIRDEVAPVSKPAAVRVKESTGAVVLEAVKPIALADPIQIDPSRMQPRARETRIEDLVEARPAR